MEDNVLPVSSRRTNPREWRSQSYWSPINKGEGMNKKENKPESGKVYALTGGPGAKCIANGNTWSESEVKDELEEGSECTKQKELKKQRSR